MSVLEWASRDTCEILEPAAIRNAAVASASVTGSSSSLLRLLILPITLNLNPSGYHERQIVRQGHFGKKINGQKTVVSDCIPSASCYASDQVSLVLVCVCVVLKYLLEYFVVYSRTSPTT